VFAELNGPPQDFVPGYRLDQSEVIYWKDAISSFGGERITQLLNSFANDKRALEIKTFGTSNIPEDFSAEGKLLPIHALLIVAMLHGFGHVPGEFKGKEGAFSTNNLLISPQPMGCLIGWDCNNYEEPVLTPQEGVFDLIERTLQETVNENNGSGQVTKVLGPSMFALQIIDDLTKSTVPDASSLVSVIEGNGALDPILYMNFGNVGHALLTMLVSEASATISKALFSDWDGNPDTMPYVAQKKLIPITETEWDVFNVKLAAWFNNTLATRWTSSIDKSDEALTNKGLAGLAIMCKLLGNFGLLQEIDGILNLPEAFELMTYNWFLLGLTSLSANACQKTTVFYEPLDRCVIQLGGFNEAIRAAFSVLNLIPGFKMIVESGDLGQLALAMLKNGLFSPYTVTKEAWAQVTLLLDSTRQKLMSSTLNANTGLFAGGLDFVAWNVSSFVPDEKEFSGSSPPPPNPQCEAGEVFKNGQCIVDTTSEVQEDPSTKPKKSFVGWLIGGALVLGTGLFLWGSNHTGEDIQIKEDQPDEP